MTRRSSTDEGGRTGGRPPSEAGDRDAVSEHRRSAVGLLRWTASRLVAAPELTAPLVVAAVLVVVAQAGIAAGDGTPRFALWVWPVYLLALVIGWVGLAATFLAAADFRTGRTRTHSRRLIVALKRIPSMAAAGVLGGIVVLAGILTLVFPGIYLGLKLSLTLPACAIDRLGAVTALRRSWVVSGGQLRTILGLFVVCVGVVSVTSVAVTVRTASIRAASQPGFVGPLVQNVVTAVLVASLGLALGRVYAVSR